MNAIYKVRTGPPPRPLFGIGASEMNVVVKRKTEKSNNDNNSNKSNIINKNKEIS